MVGSYDDDEPGSPWTVALFVDDGADGAQLAALADIFLGRAGGTPSRHYSPAIQSVAGVATAVVRLDHDRRHWRIRVDGRVDVAADEEVDSDEPVACGIPGLDQPGQKYVRRGCEPTSTRSFGSGRIGAGSQRSSRTAPTARSPSAPSAASGRPGEW
jgi:hypothetical protein